MDDQDGMDPCECVWSHELAMRRLLNLLRNSQSLCTDTECYEDPSSPDTSTNNILMATLLIIVTFFLLYFRPRSQRLTSPSKSNDFDHDFGAPPAPPTST